MPRPSIEHLRGLGDLSTNYQWNLNFVTFPIAVTLAGRFPKGEDLNKRCISTTLPKKSTGRLTANIRGYQVNQPGTLQYNESIQLEFIETVDNVVSLFLLAWHELCSRTGTQIHWPKDMLESIIQIERLDRQDNPIWLYVLYGCFLMDYEHGELNSSNGLLQPKITITYDYFKEQPLGSLVSF